MAGKTPWVDRNRNYGCRIKQFQIGRHKMVSMENELLYLRIDQTQGGQIDEFVYKPKDIDVLFHYPFGRVIDSDTALVKDEDFMDRYRGGWQELFPLISRSDFFHGSKIGMHGEAAMLPWNLKILEDEVNATTICLSADMIKTPFHLEKTLYMRERSNKLRIRETVTNTSMESLSFQWGHHPALGGRFLDGSCRILLPGNPEADFTVAELGKTSPIVPGERGRWPELSDRNGKICRLDEVQPMESRQYLEFCLSDLEGGSFIVRNMNLDLDFGMTWDPNIFRHLWVWQMYGGGEGYPYYGRAYTLALEPWSSVPDGLCRELPQNEKLELLPGETINTELEAWIGSTFAE